MTIGQTNAYHLVTLVDVNGTDTGGTHVLILVETCLLDDTLLGGKYHIVGLQELFVVEVLDAQNCIDGIIRLNVEHILDGATLGVLVALGNLVTLLPVATALLGEEQQRVVHGGGIDILGKVVVTMTGSLGTYASTALLVELVQMGTLDVTHVRNGNNHWIVGIEVLGIKLVIEGNNLGTTLVAILLLHLLQLVLHHLLATLGVIQDFLQVGYQLHEVIVLLMQLIDTQTGQLAQTHIDDGLRL